MYFDKNLANRVLNILYAMSFTNAEEDRERKRNISLAFNNKGNVYLILGDYSKSFLMFKKSVEIDVEPLLKDINRLKKQYNITI